MNHKSARIAWIRTTQVPSMEPHTLPLGSSPRQAREQHSPTQSMHTKKSRGGREGWGGGGEKNSNKDLLSLSGYEPFNSSRWSHRPSTARPIPRQANERDTPAQDIAQALTRRGMAKTARLCVLDNRMAHLLEAIEPFTVWLTSSVPIKSASSIPLYDL